MIPQGHADLPIIVAFGRNLARPRLGAEQAKVSSPSFFTGIVQSV